MQPGKLRGLQRLAGETGRFEILAIDQRPPLMQLVAERGVADVAPNVARIKAAVIHHLQDTATATLIDPIAGVDLFDRLAPRRGLILTLEDHRYRDAAGGRQSHTIEGWTVERIKSTGADAVKLLAWHRPDAGSSTRRHQDHFVEAVGQACAEHAIPFVLELLVYPLHDEHGEIPSERKSDLALKSLSHFAAPKFAVDLFKVECPTDLHDLARSRSTQSMSDHFAAVDDVVRRPWVVLSGGADRVHFLEVVHLACQAGASGYLAGRSIWWNSATQFPDFDAIERRLHEDARGFMHTLHDVVESSAPAWYDRTGVLGPASVRDDLPLLSGSSW
jgi:tagatose 1,6-diphosphate aldolase